MVGAETVARILAKAKRLAEFHVTHVKSTYYGGGVAELQATLVLRGNFASDDPEGAEIYESLLNCREPPGKTGRFSSMVDQQEPGWQLASRAVDLFVSEMACNVTSDGIQVLGGNGYMHDYSQEKSFRDARQIQALMGLAPMRKLAYIERIIEGEPL